MKVKCILSVLLAAVCLFFAACGGNGGEDGQRLTANRASEGVHEYSAQPTGDFIVQGGASPYTVVLPADSTSNEKLAADEFIAVFEEATGIALPSSAEDAYAGDKGIYLGATAYKSANDGSFDAERLGQSGFRIVTKNKNIIVYGYGEYGTLYGTYELLHQLFGFETFTQNYSYTQKNVRELPLYDYTITDIPDIQTRLAGYGYVAADSTYMNRMRQVRSQEFFGTFNGSLYHNSFKVLPREVYEEEHPKWYAKNKLQLCYTAQGDETEYKKMTETVAEELKQELIADPSCTSITFTHEDNQSWCNCAECQLMYEHYHANSAVLIRFCNRVRTLIEEWFNGEGAQYRREFTLVFFAYHQTNAAPVVYDASTDSYAPVDDSVRCIEGVKPFFAESNGDYTHSYYEEENAEIAENMKGWSAVTDSLYFWFYSVNMSCYFTMYDSFNAMLDIYRYAKDNGAEMIFDQGAFNEQGMPSAWSMLKIWLYSKMTWNVNADVNALIDEFFELYYMEAAQPMREYFEAYRSWAQYQKEVLGYGGSRSIFYSALKQELWPQRTLDMWLEKIQEALDCIAPLAESDAARYAILYDNITCERNAVIYLLLSLYSGNYSNEEVAQYRRWFRDDTIRLGNTNASEFTAISDAYASLGIQ